MPDMNQLASALFGTTRAETRDYSAHVVQQATGMAVTDSDGGRVTVVLDGADATTSDGSNRVELPTEADVRAGDAVSVRLSGEGVQVPTVTGVVGGGDRMREEIRKANKDLSDAMDKLRGELAGKTNGFYHTEVTQDDGSTVWYVHDQPALADSTLQWKLTADALALSTDGGRTWPYGFDVSGAAMMNYIQTHGLKADWINTGRISSKDGSSYIDLDTGDFSLGMGDVSGLDEALVENKTAATAAQAKADDAWARTLRVEVMSAPADAAGDTSLLTAYAFRGGELLSDETVAKMGLLAWYVGGSRVATGSTYTCAAGTAVECRLEA